MVQPALTVDLSLRQVKVEPAATATLLGPTVPLYRRPAMVTRSQNPEQSSMSNSVAVSVPAWGTRTVQASLLPYGPTPSVTQPLSSIEQYSAPAVTSIAEAATI